MNKINHIFFKIMIALEVVIIDDVATIPHEKKVMQPISSNLKHEYCVKIVRVCYLLWDSPPDYTDDELEHPTSEIEEDFREAGCIPENLSDYQRDEFWKRVAKLNHDIDQHLLKSNTFVIKAQPEDGNAIRINMWNVFKIPIVVICNRLSDLPISTTISPANKNETIENELKMNTENILDMQKKSPSFGYISSTISDGLNANSLGNTSTADMNDDLKTSLDKETTPISEMIRWVCGKPYKIALWIDQQVELTQDFDNVNKQLSQIIKKLMKQKQKDCCPYKSVMDRIEILHDILDVIIKMKNVKFLARSKSSGYMWLDFDHLNTRLDYLNEQLIDNPPATTTIETNKCCPEWDNKMKKLTNKFNSQINEMEKFTSDKSLDNYLLESQIKIEKYWSNHQKHLEIFENSLLSTNTAECCKNTELNMKNTKITIDNLKLNDYFKHLTNLMERSFKYTSNMNYTISSLNLSIQVEGKMLENITLLCTRDCVKKEKFKGKELNHFETKINSIVKSTKLMQSNISSYESMKTSLKKWDSIKSKLKKFEISAKVESDNLNKLSQYSDNLRQRLEKLDKLNQLFKELIQLYQTNVKSYENMKSGIEKTYKELYAKYQLIEESLEKLSTPSLVSKTEIQSPLKDLGKLLHEIKNDFQFVVSPLIKIYLEHSIMNLTYIKNIGSKLMHNLTTNALSLLDLSSNLNKLDPHLEGRIKELESDIILNTTSSSNDISNIHNKFKNLESHFNNVTNQSLSTKDKLIKRIKNLESLLKDFNEKFKNTLDNTFICEDKCDWGHLPTAEALMDRVMNIKSIVDHNRSIHRARLLKTKQKYINPPS